MHVSKAFLRWRHLHTRPQIMVDTLTPERRSWLMSKVKSKDTKPEMVVRKLLHSRGYRYRLHVATLPGKPDIVFSKRKKIVFVHGCFWHGHMDCKYGRLPKARLEFWEGKVIRNRERDAKNMELLKNEGWEILVVWQCQTKTLETLTEKLHEFLK